MTDEDRYDDSELREAEALAEALERAPEQRAIDPTSAADAIDAAELIAASRLPELSLARAEEVLRSVNARIAQRIRRRRRAIGLAALASTLAAAAVALLVLTRPADSPALHEPVALSPAPSAPGAREAVVLAQRAWLGDPSPPNRTALRGQLAKFRAAHVAELDRRLAP